MTFDKSQVSAAFSKAARRYDDVALMQNEVAKRLFDRLEYIKIDPSVVLDLGCGAGAHSRTLLSRFSSSRVISLDLSHAMLMTARQRKRWFSAQHFVCADAEHLPLADSSVDLIFSNMVVHWCDDLNIVFREIFRVLKPGGLLFFSTLGPDTLQELRSSWAQVDEREHVHQFVDMHDIGDVLVSARFSDPVLDREMLTLLYSDVMSLMRDVKSFGGQNQLQNRHRGLTAKTAISKLVAAYQHFCTPEGQYPLSYEVIYGHAWCPNEKNLRSANAEGEVSFPLSQLMRRK